MVPEPLQPELLPYSVSVLLKGGQPAQNKLLTCPRFAFCLRCLDEWTMAREFFWFKDKTMGLSTILDMRVQTESGEPVGPDEFVPIDALPYDPDQYPFLSSIAPYEYTVFNPTQCQLLLAEWNQAASDPRWKRLTSELKVVRDAAARCASEHLYLKFIGD
jgi:hypothetical protein